MVILLDVEYYQIIRICSEAGEDTQHQVQKPYIKLTRYIIIEIYKILLIENRKMDKISAFLLILNKK